MSLRDILLGFLVTVMITGAVMRFYPKKDPEPTPMDYRQEAPAPPQKQVPNSGIYTGIRLEDLVKDERPTPLMYEKAKLAMFTGYTYRYDIVIDDTYYFIWVDKEGKVTQFGPAPDQE